jgi:two-component system, chemotaxis family, protein-glutamate methylesterase/glutaminase
VREASPCAEVRPGTILLAPGDHHLEVEPVGTGVRAILGKGAPENSCRPSVDVLFRSATRVYGAHVLAVVLTGMGADGRSGSEHVHEAGGHVIVQDQATSVVWGMPGAVVEAGVADQVVPLQAIAEAIRARTACGLRPQEVRA